MKLDFNGIIYALSYALDSVEAETGHGKWVAYLSVLLGKGVGMEERELADLAACAALHDNALTQYISEEKNVSKTNLPNAGKHCVLGEENIRNFPFHTDAHGPAPPVLHPSHTRPERIRSWRWIAGWKCAAGTWGRICRPV